MAKSFREEDRQRKDEVAAIVTRARQACEEQPQHYTLPPTSTGS